METSEGGTSFVVHAGIGPTCVVVPEAPLWGFGFVAKCCPRLLQMQVVSLRAIHSSTVHTTKSCGLPALQLPRHITSPLVLQIIHPDATVQVLWTVGQRVLKSKVQPVKIFSPLDWNILLNCDKISLAGSSTL